MARSHNKNLDGFFLTPSFFADPYPFYHQLRTEAPVHWSERLNAWLLTRYDDVKSCLNDPRLNSGDRIVSLMKRLPPTSRARFEPLLAHLNNMMSFRDPPDHTRLRRLSGPAFTPRVMNNLKPKIQAIVDELLNDLANKGQFDLVNDFAFHLPAIVICEMLGIPRDDRNKMKCWSNDILGFLSAGTVTTETAEHAQEAVFAATAYLQGLVDDRRLCSQDDLMSVLIVAEDEDNKLDGSELIALIVQLFSAGFETTEGLIGNGMLALLQHPDQLQLLRENPSLIETAVEEFLRFDNSVQRQARVSNEDMELRGQRIRAGEYLALLIGAANRDPAQFPNPDRLDIARQGNKHVSFGHGIHFCLGGPLARIETQIAFNAILHRMPNIQLADHEPEFTQLVALRKLKSLPVTI